MHRLTPRLTLRRPIASDLERLFAIYGDPATHQFNPFGPLLKIEQAQALLEKWTRHWDQQGYGQWAIASRADPEHVIGFGGIDARYFLEVERINLGYRFAPDAWGQGYATELGRAALEFGLIELKLAEIFAIVRPTHQGSIRILEKIGMRVHGELDDVPGQAPSLVFNIRPLDSH
jgi:RimJ/RimL family protein N-acetyltransferase